MRELRPRTESTAAELVVADVAEAPAGDALLLNEGGVTYPARRAKSCLVAPEPGDRVLVALAPDGDAFVTAVLAGADDASTRLEVQGDLDLRAATGRVQVTARDGVALRSTGVLDLLADELRVQARVGAVAVERLGFTGEALKAALERVRLVARSSESVVGRVVQRLGTRLSKVTDADHLQARNRHEEIDELASQQAGYSVLRARNEVRIDGKQILMG